MSEAQKIMVDKAIEFTDKALSAGDDPSDYPVACGCMMAYLQMIRSCLTITRDFDGKQ